MGDRPNMRDVAGEESNPGKRGNPGKLTPVSDKDIDIIKGDKSESGSNSYAKSVKDTIKKLKGVKLTPVSDKDIETLKK
jgi:hypothetical protein